MILICENEQVRMVVGWEVRATTSYEDLGSPRIRITISQTDATHPNQLKPSMKLRPSFHLALLGQVQGPYMPQHVPYNAHRLANLK